MGYQTLRVIFFWFINLLLLTYYPGVFASPASENNYLVSFKPEIIIKNQPCQGILVSDQLLASSKPCVQALRKRIQKEDITLWAGSEQTGHLVDYSVHDALDIASRLNSEILLPYQQQPGVQEEFIPPKRYQYDPGKKKAGVYTIKYLSDGVLMEQLLSVKIHSDANRLLSFNLPEGNDYPEGAPVFYQDEVVCLWSGAGSCMPLDAVSKRVKPKGDGSCNLHHAQCSDPQILSCDQGYGIGNCTNALTSERCFFTTHPKEATLGRLTCTQIGGCEQVLCPGDHISASLGYSCLAQSGFDGSQSASPDGCIALGSGSCAAPTATPSECTQSDCDAYKIRYWVATPILIGLNILQCGLLIMFGKLPTRK